MINDKFNVPDIAGVDIYMTEVTVLGTIEVVGVTVVVSLVDTIEVVVVVIAFAVSLVVVIVAYPIVRVGES